MIDVSPRKTPRAKLLVVDDLYANRLAMRHVLAGLDVEIVEAASGNEALTACLEHEFALILLDVQMPGMDGVEVAQLLNDEESTRHTAVIFVTAGSTDDMGQLKGYDAGAVDYIVKPVNARLLSAKVRNFVELYDSRQALKGALAELDAANTQLRQEIDERKRAQAQAQQLATHDALTGLPNRLLFMDRLATSMSRARRKGSVFALGYMDLDGFKPVNDAYGHRAGDIVLGEIARRLLAHTRESDTTARLGGDEFALILEDVSGDAACLERSRKVLKAISAPICVSAEGSATTVQIGMSMGIALFPLHGNNADQLMHNADRALYAVKDNGKADVRIFCPEDDRNSSVLKRSTDIV